MAQDHYYSDLNMHMNQFVEARFEGSAGHPIYSAKAGAVYYNSGEFKTLFVFDESRWRPLGRYTELNFFAPLVKKPVSDVFPENGEYDITLPASSSKDNGYMSMESYNRLWSMLFITDDTDIPHASGGSEHVIGGGITVFTAISRLDAWDYDHTGSGLPDSNSPHNEVKKSAVSTDVDLGGVGSSHEKLSTQLAIKTYVDAHTSSGRPAQPYADTPGSWIYPASHYGESIIQGDQFIIEVDGVLIGPNSVPVNANDTLISKVANPGNVDVDWSVIVSTPVQKATESAMGILAIATIAEAEALIVDDKTITPKKLKAALKNNSYALIRTLSSSSTSITVTHNFNSMKTIVDLYSDTTGLSFNGEISRTLNTVTVNINSTPGSTWTVVVAGEDNSF